MGGMITWFHSPIASYEQLLFGQLVGFRDRSKSTLHRPHVGHEFGTCNVSVNRNWVRLSKAWFSNFTQYFGDIDWAYWPINGTMARGEGRSSAPGLFARSFWSELQPELLNMLREIQQSCFLHEVYRSTVPHLFL